MAGNKRPMSEETKGRILRMFVSGLSPLEIVNELMNEGIYLLPSDVISVYNDHREGLLSEIENRNKIIIEANSPVALIDRVLTIIGRLEKEEIGSRNAITISQLYRVIADLWRLYYTVKIKIDEEVERRVEKVLEEWEAKQNLILEASQAGMFDRFTKIAEALEPAEAELRLVERGDE